MKQLKYDFPRVLDGGFYFSKLLGLNRKKTGLKINYFELDQTRVDFLKQQGVCAKREAAGRLTASLPTWTATRRAWVGAVHHAARGRGALALWTGTTIDRVHTPKGYPMGRSPRRWRHPCRWSKLTGERRCGGSGHLIWLSMHQTEARDAANPTRPRERAGSALG